MKNLLIINLVLISLIILFGLIEGTKFPALFAFGDSILDTGNNNYLASPAKCNFPPYGRDLNGGIPTGRFGNGRVLSDILISGFKIKKKLPAFMDPLLKKEEIPTGVNFASGGSGLDTITASLLGVIWVPDQVKMFEQYKVKLTSMVGEKESKKIISNSIYVLSAANNDIVITYFSSPTRRFVYNVTAYSQLLTDWTSTFLQDMYKLGARRFIVLSTLPLGCLPLATLVASKCNKDLNEASKIFNNMLSKKTSSLQKTMKKAKLMYYDIYTPLLDLINHPKKHGFKDGIGSCCCTVRALIPCEHDSEFVFWDYAHPTEQAYKVLAPKIIESFKKKIH